MSDHDENLFPLSTAAGIDPHARVQWRMPPELRQAHHSRNIRDLNDDDIEQIRQLIEAGGKNDAIALRFGVSKKLIAAIRSGKVWCNAVSEAGRDTDNNRTEIFQPALQRERHLLDRVARGKNDNSSAQKRRRHLRIGDYLRSPHTKLAAAYTLRERAKKGKSPFCYLTDEALIRYAESVDAFSAPPEDARIVRVPKKNGRSHRETVDFPFVQRISQEMIRHLVDALTDRHPRQVALRGGHNAAIKFVKQQLRDEAYTHVVVCDVKDLFPSINAASAAPFLPLAALRAALEFGSDTLVRVDEPSASLDEDGSQSDLDGSDPCDEASDCERGSEPPLPDQERERIASEAETTGEERPGDRSDLPGGSPTSYREVERIGTSSTEGGDMPSSVPETCGSNAVNVTTPRRISAPVRLPQGAVCSMLIAERVMADVLRRLPGTPVSFVDDVVILCRGSTEAEAASSQLLEALETCPAGALQPRHISTKPVSNGFSFLGYHIRRYQGQIFAMPTKSNWNLFTKRVRKSLITYAKTGDEMHKIDSLLLCNAWFKQFNNWDSYDLAANDKLTSIEYLCFSGPPASQGLDSMAGRVNRIDDILAKPGLPT